MAGPGQFVFANDLENGQPAKTHNFSRISPNVSPHVSIDETRNAQSQRNSQFTRNRLDDDEARWMGVQDGRPQPPPPIGRDHFRHDSYDSTKVRRASIDRSIRELIKPSQRTERKPRSRSQPDGPSSSDEQQYPEPPRYRYPNRSVDVMQASSHASAQLQRHHATAILSSQSMQSYTSSADVKRKRELTFAERVFEAGKPDLLYDLRDNKQPDVAKRCVLDLTTLQRMNEHVLQQKLVEQVAALGQTGAWMEIGIRETLHDYCTAIRDSEYMQQRAQDGQDQDPFLLSTSKELESKLLSEAGLVINNTPQRSFDEAHPRLPIFRRQKAKPGQKTAQRLFFALAGGIALVAPMLIMLLAPSKLTTLVTTAAFVLGVAAITAVATDLSPDRIAVVVAAYAAALIVFAGNIATQQGFYPNQGY